MKPKENTREVIDENANLTEEGFVITKPFLEFAFDKQIRDFSVKLGTNLGDNYASLIYAVEVIFQGNEEEEASHYLIKCYPNHPGRRAMLDHMNWFGKELFMYEEFITKLKLTLQDSGADPDLVSFSSVQFHGGNVARCPSAKWKDSPWVKENFIIMTDIRESGFVMGDRLKGLDIEHAKLALQEMAKWHAMAWAHKQKNGLTFLSEKYPELIESVYSNEENTESFGPFLEMTSGNALKVTGESLGKEHPAHVNFSKLANSGILDKIRKFMRAQVIDDEEFDDMMRVAPEDDPEYSEGPWLTLTHGDCWVNNMLFRYNSVSGVPDQVTFIDLQACRETCPTLDISYFLTTSVRAPLRIPNKNELLQAYHDSFLICCKEMEVKPYPGFSMSSLKRRYRRAELFSLLIFMHASPMQLKPKERIVDMDESKDGKEDVDEIYADLVRDSDENEIFGGELVATVLDLYENGVI